jgi:Rab-GTPase-TBC domain
VAEGAGWKLPEQCLAHLDKELLDHLQSRNLKPWDYAYFSIYSLSAFGKSLDQVRLWDLFFSHGVHLNLLAVASQMLFKRDAIMGGQE